MYDGAEEWAATDLWLDFDYIEKRYGKQSLEIVRLDRGNVESLKKIGKTIPDFSYKTGFARRNTF